MKAMARYQFGISWTSDLLMNNPEGSMKLPGTGAGVKNIPTPEVEAKRSLYLLEGGQLYVPAVAFVKSIVTAAKGRKIGKLGAPTVLLGAVYPIPEFERCPLVNAKTGKPLKEYAIDTRRVVIPSSGAAVLRSRARVSNWATTVTLEIDDELIPPEMVEEFLIRAGRNVGIMDFRPECGGYFGRFEAKLVQAVKKAAG